MPPPSYQESAPLVTASRVIRLLRPYVLHLKALESAIELADDPSKQAEPSKTLWFDILRSPKRQKRHSKTVAQPIEAADLDAPESSRAPALRQARRASPEPAVTDTYRPTPLVVKAIRDVQRSFENIVDATYGKRKARAYSPIVGPLSLQAICTRFVGRNIESNVNSEWALHVKLLDEQDEREEDDAPGYTITEAEDWKHERIRELYEQLPESMLRHAVLEHVAILAAKITAHPARNILIEGMMSVCLEVGAFGPYASLTTAFLPDPSETLATCLRALQTAAHTDSEVALEALGRSLRLSTIPDPSVRQTILPLVDPTILLHHLSNALASGQDTIAVELLSEIMAKHTSSTDCLKHDMTLRKNLSRLLATVRQTLQRLPAGTTRPVATLTAFHLCLLGQLGGLVNLRPIERGLLPHLRSLTTNPGLDFGSYHPRALPAIYNKVAAYGELRPSHVLVWLLNFAASDYRVEASSKAWVGPQLRVEEACIIASDMKRKKFARVDSGKSWTWDKSIEQYVAASPQRSGPTTAAEVEIETKAKIKARPPRLNLEPASQRAHTSPYRAVIEKFSADDAGLHAVYFERDSSRTLKSTTLHRPTFSPGVPKNPGILKVTTNSPLSSADPMEGNYGVSPIRPAHKVRTVDDDINKCSSDVSPLVVLDQPKKRSPCLVSPIPKKRRRKLVAAAAC